MTEEIVKLESRSKLPSLKFKGEYFEFDAYERAAKVLVQRIDELMLDEDKERRSTVSADDLERCYRTFDEGRTAFERDELYRVRRTARQNLLGTWTKREIARRVVAEKIGFLVGAVQIVATGNPEVFVGLLIEETVAANPTVSALESTCRALWRKPEIKFLSIAHVGEELRKQSAFWDECLFLTEADIAHWAERCAGRRDA